MRILVPADLIGMPKGGHVDEELRQLDLAIAESRLLADEAIAGLGAPQDALRAAAADYIESIAQRRIDATRHASVAVMAHLSDDDVAELHYWTHEEVARARATVESGIEACDFWIGATSGLSLTDVSTYAAALVPRPKDTKSGIPQTLVLLFEQCILSLRRGLAVVGLSVVPAEVDLTVEYALVRAWQAYRTMAVECLVTWADIDDRYQASSARFQEMRWEMAADADVAAIQARRTTEDTDVPEAADIADVEVEMDPSGLAASDGYSVPAKDLTGAEALVPASS